MRHVTTQNSNIGLISPLHLSVSVGIVMGVELDNIGKLVKINHLGKLGVEEYQDIGRKSRWGMFSFDHQLVVQAATTLDCTAHYLHSDWWTGPGTAVRLLRLRTTRWSRCARSRGRWCSPPLAAHDLWRGGGGEREGHQRRPSPRSGGLRPRTGEGGGAQKQSAKLRPRQPREVVTVWRRRHRGSRLFS